MSTLAADVSADIRPDAKVATRTRIHAIDLARGFAVALMILSHGVNGLLRVAQLPDWGVVPIHVITKFSSSLFFIVFGIALAVVFEPKTRSPDWPRRRNRLLLRGLLVLFWYKVLTVVEMYDRHDTGEIAGTLLYQDFPSFVEILGFYAIALLILPWLLPLWARLSAPVRWTSPLIVATLAWWLLHNFSFWNVPQLQAVLVEHPEFYTWGLLSRLPLVLVGLLIGGLLREAYHQPAQRMELAWIAAIAGFVLLAIFVQLAGEDRGPLLHAIAANEGKHPPELMFMLFSIGGAMLLLSIAIAGGNRLAQALKPITVIGTNALMAFIFHITVIFVLFRDVLGYHQSVSYSYALALTVLLIAATALWIWLWQQMRATLQARRPRA